MSAQRGWAVHVAAQPDDMIQCCSRCGAVLQDNTAFAEGRVAAVGVMPPAPHWWSTGVRVAVRGGASYAIVDSYQLTLDEQPCEPQETCSDALDRAS